MADELSKNIDLFKEQVFKVNYDISKNFLPTSEIVKNIIASKSNYSKDDLSMIVDGKMKNAQFDEKKANADKKQSNTEGKKGSDDLVDVKGVAAKAYPLPQNNSYYQEAEDTKDKVRVAASMLMKEKNSVAKELAAATIAIANSVPAIISLATTFPIPNVNAAITIACSVISQILKLIDKITDVFLHIGPLKKLKLLVPADKYKDISKPISAALKALTALLVPILALEKIIKSLLAKISSSNSADNKRKRREKLVKSRDAKQKEINDANNDKNYTEASKLENEKKEIQDQIDDIDNGVEGRDPVTGKPMSSNFEDIQRQIDEQVKVANEAVVAAYVYDVKLPDGTMLTNQSDEDLAKLTEQFKIIYQNG